MRGPRRIDRRDEAPRIELEIPEDVTGLEIDRAVKAELRTLSKENAQGVGAHLIMVARLIDEDIELAKAHADAAVRRAGRVPSVREARGLVAYTEGDWNVALSEFRTARRLSGSDHLLPYLVDCERALGRTEKALELARSREVAGLPAAERVEIAIVVSGIRRDLGQHEAALTELEGAHLVPGRSEVWAPRLYYAYADALMDLGRTEEARRWFQAAADVDTDLQTDAWERLDELDGTVMVDLMDDVDEDDTASDETAENDAVEAHIGENDAAEVGADDEGSDQGASVDTDTVDDGRANVRPNESVSESSVKGTSQPATEHGVRFVSGRPDPVTADDGDEGDDGESASRS